MKNKSFRRERPMTILDVTKTKMVKEKRGIALINPYESLNKVSKRRVSVATDARAIREMLPEVKLVENLLIDSILSANDLTTVEINFKLDNSRFSNSTVVTKVLDEMHEFFVNTHKIKPRLKRYLRNILFDYGSQTIVVLPENSIDAIINKDIDTSTGLESFKDEVKTASETMTKNIGLLGTGLNFSKIITVQNTRKSGFGIEDIFGGGPRSYSTDASFNKLGYCVHDNPHVLKMSELSSTLRKFVEKKRLSDIGIESFGIGASYRTALNGQYGAGAGSNMVTLANPKDREKLNTLYQDKGNRNEEFVKVEPQSQLTRASVGHPVQIEPSAEAVIPITVPGTPDEKIGVILLLGEDGKPISMETEINRWNTVSSLQDGYTSSTGEDNDTTASSAIRTAFMKVYGQQNPQTKEDIKQLNDMYSQLVIDDLNQRMLDGIYGHTVSIAAHENIFKVMLARHLSNMNTRLLYIPESLVTYMAFDYNEDGTGRALTEDVKIIASYRSMVMMATVLAQVKSSLNHTKLRIKLDEDDMEPDDAVRQALEEYANFQATMPFGNTSYHQQYSYFQQAAVSVEVDGNDNYIDMKVETDVSQRRYEAPDNDLNERLRKDFLSAYGVTTEHLEQIMSSDTATAVRAATANFTKNTQNYRHIFNHFMTDYVRKFVANSQPLRDAIEKILIEHKDELPSELAKHFKDNDNNLKLAVNDIIRELIFELPDAVVNLSTAKVESFESFSRFVDAWVESNISTDYVNELGVGEIGAETVDLLRNTAKSSLLRQYLQDNGFGTRFDELLFGTEEEATLDKVGANHLKALSKIIVNFSNHLKLTREAVQANLQKTAGDVDDLSVSTSDSSFDSGSSDSFDDDFGSDDTDSFDLDSEFESEEEKVEEDSLDEDLGDPNDLGGI